MSELLKIITNVYCNDEYAEPPICAVTYLTSKDLERYEKLSEVVKENKALNISIFSHTSEERCRWYDSFPLYKFEDLNRYLHYADVEYFDDKPFDENNPPETNFVPLGTEKVVVTENGFYYEACGKYSGTRIETEEVNFSKIHEVLEMPPPPKHGYFLSNRKGHPKPLIEAPKFINDSNPEVAHYYKEMLKNKGDVI